MKINGHLEDGETEENTANLLVDDAPDWEQSAEGLKEAEVEVAPNNNCTPWCCARRHN